MTRTKNIREGLIELNFSKVEHELKKQILTAELPIELLEMVMQTGCLLIRHADPDRDEKRARFITSLRNWFSAIGNRDARDRLDVHCSQAELCQQAFRKIYLSLENCPVGQASPAISAWAAVLATAADMTDVRRAISEKPPPLIAPGLIFLSPEWLRVNALGKSDLDPDAAAEHYAYNLGGYLKMLGYLHGWFENGLLRIPAEALVSSDLLEDRSALYLAEAWNQLDDHWGRIRYFKGSSVHSEARSYSTTKGVREITTLVFKHDWQYFLEIEVARARLRRQVFEISMHVINSPKTAERVQDPTEHHVEVFPRGLISVHEAAAMLALDMCYGLPLTTDNTEYLGLKLPEWLRGYALLQFCCERRIALTPIADGVCYLDVDAFLNLAERAGMVRERILLFVKQATFQKNSRDLFDAPLIPTADNRYIVLSCLNAHYAIHEVLTSRINSLLLQVEKKGPVFEREVRESFEKLGATAKRIEYSNAEGNFECDAAVLWSQDLFLVECKAYTLPQGSASDLFFFQLRQEEAGEQIRRVARHFAQDATIIGKAFGPNFAALRTTICVLNLAPFSLPGEGRDVKFYDRGALSKFSEGAIKAVVYGPNNSGARGIIARLWASSVPTPDDLLKQMDQPFQYLNESTMWGVEELLVPLSDELVMLSPFLGRRADQLSDVPATDKEIQATTHPSSGRPPD